MNVLSKPLRVKVGGVDRDTDRFPSAEKREPVRTALEPASSNDWLWRPSVNP